jgi:hypothetical protein
MIGSQSLAMARGRSATLHPAPPPVAKHNGFPRYSGNAIAWNQDAYEVEWISSRNCDRFSRGRQLASGAQRFDCDGQGELFAKEPVHEAATANLASIFETPECHLKFAPLGKISFARQQIVQRGCSETLLYRTGCQISRADQCRAVLVAVLERPEEPRVVLL